MAAPATVFETRQAAADRRLELKTLCATASDAAEAAGLIERHAMNEPAYRGMEHRDAVAALLSEAPILQAVYEEGRRALLVEFEREQAAQREALARVLNPDDDPNVAKKEMPAMWNPDKIEAERRAYELYRKSSYNNREQLVADRRVEKRAEGFDSALMSLAEVAATRDGVPVHEAVAKILKASRALDIARVAAGRGARVPGAIACLNTAYRAAATAPEGQAVAAAAKVAARFDPGPPPED